MKRPIDFQREGAAFMNVGSPDDLSPITSMIVIGKMLYVVKASSVYQVRMADDINPERTNPSVPNTQQKILGVGSDSEVVGRTVGDIRHRCRGLRRLRDRKVRCSAGGRPCR
jgi:hypothetical protein